MRPPTRITAALALVALLVVGMPATASHADGRFTVSWTHIGIYPRTFPELRADNKAGSAVPDGTVVTVVCEASGQTVTSDVGTSDIWESTTIGWIPNVFVETGVNGWTPGIPRCGESGPVGDPGSDPGPAPEDPPASDPEPPQAPADEAVPVDGIPLPGGWVPLQLYYYYLSGIGGTAVVDWSFFAADSHLMAWSMSNVEVGSYEQYLSEANRELDVYLAVGNFEVERTSEHCFVITDAYDFTVTKWTDVYLIPFVLKKYLGHAADFTVKSSGCV